MSKSQLRKHLQRTWRVRFRNWQARRKLQFCGQNVHIEKNVEFMRFPDKISVADNVVVKEGARICACNKDALIQIGTNTTIGYHTFIFSSLSVKIGADCLIAPFVYIVDSDHKIDKQQLINQQENQTEAVEIGDDVWIGTGAKILKGVTIGKGAVIAAGAVLSTDVNPYDIVGGIPARKISERK